MKCENCDIQHDGAYGSGRFCSSKCARGFSTKKNRVKINEKKRKTLLERHKKQEKWCLRCGMSLGVNYRKGTKFCSKQCSYIPLTREQKDHLSQLAMDRDLKGSYGVRCIVKWGEQEIKTDSILEVVCVQYLLEELNAESIKRSKLSLPYTDYLGIERKYNPDFEVILDGKLCIVECKSHQHSESSNNAHWKRYKENAIIKRKAIEAYSKENGITYIHYTQETEPGKYRKILREYRKTKCKLYTINV